MESMEWQGTKRPHYPPRLYYTWADKGHRKNIKTRMLSSMESACLFTIKCYECSNNNDQLCSQLFFYSLHYIKTGVDGLCVKGQGAVSIVPLWPKQWMQFSASAGPSSNCI